jgi:ABC-2 type transport system permease protein
LKITLFQLLEAEEMYNLILADLFKLRKSPVIKISFIITAISAAVTAVMAYLIPQGSIDVKMAGMGFLFSDISMMGILGAAVAGTFICGDFDNKTIHDAIAGGCSRWAVIVSKAAVFFCSIAFLLIPYIISACISLSTGSKFSMGSVVLGFLNLMTTDSAKTLSAAEIWKLAAVILTLIIVYISQLSICIPLALVLKKPVLVVAINYGFSILCGQLIALKGSSKVFDNIFALTPYGGSYIFTSLSTGMEDILKAVLVSLIFIILMLALTYGAFRKSEIK